MKAIRIFISGRVQGVCFRAFIREHAQNLGLTGWVKNLDDGRVEAIIEGSEKNVNKLLESCKKGPAYSRIKDIEIEKIKEEGFDGFVVRY